MLSKEDLIAILERFASDTATEADRVVLRKALSRGEVTLERSEGDIVAANGQNNIVIGRSADGALVITGGVTLQGGVTFQVLASGRQYDRLFSLLFPERRIDWKNRLRRAAPFLIWMTAMIAISLMTDIAHRLLIGKGGWLETAGAFARIFFFTLSGATACLAAFVFLLPEHRFVERVASLAWLKRLSESRRTTVISCVALIGVSSVLWLSLPNLYLARLYNDRGYEHREQRNLSRALELYERAISVKEDYAPARYNLAVAYEDLHQRDKAEEQYLKAIRYDNRIYPAYNNLARLRLLGGDKDTARLALNLLVEARDLSPRDESPQDQNVQYTLHRNIGWANMVLGDYDLAEQNLTRAISLRPDKAGAHCLLAIVLNRAGKAEEIAGECYECVSLSANAGAGANGEQVEEEWLNHAKNCLSEVYQK
jgi:tetratricopeptide (TPR) repeat protein